jgi:hypothetical protein
MDEMKSWIDNIKTADEIARTRTWQMEDPYVPGSILQDEPEIIRAKSKFDVLADVSDPAVIKKHTTRLERAILCSSLTRSSRKSINSFVKSHTGSVGSSVVNALERLTAAGVLYAFKRYESSFAASFLVKNRYGALCFIIKQIVTVEHFRKNL